MNNDPDENKNSTDFIDPEELFKRIKEIQGLPDEIIHKFLSAKGILSMEKNEQK